MFNVNWQNKSERKNLKEITDHFNVAQVIEGPTRITKSSRKQIDLVFSNKPERIIKTYNYLIGVSDHNAVFVSRKLGKKRLNHKTNICKQMFIPKSQEQNLAAALNNLDWSEITTCSNTDKCCDLMHSSSNDILKQFQRKGINKKVFSTLDQ